MIFVKHIFDFFSQTTAQILMKFGSHMHVSKVTEVCSNQGCMTYFHRISSNELLGSYVTCIFSMYYYILFLTSLKPNHRFDSNFVWMFLVWSPTKFVKIWVLPLLLWDFG